MPISQKKQTETNNKNKINCIMKVFYSIWLVLRIIIYHISYESFVWATAHNLRQYLKLVSHISQSYCATSKDLEYSAYSEDTHTHKYMYADLNQEISPDPSIHSQVSTSQLEILHNCQVISHVPINHESTGAWSRSKSITYEGHKHELDSGCCCFIWQNRNNAFHQQTSATMSFINRRKSKIFHRIKPHTHLNALYDV